MAAAPTSKTSSGASPISMEEFTELVKKKIDGSIQPPFGAAETQARPSSSTGASQNEGAKSAEASAEEQPAPSSLEAGMLKALEGLGGLGRLGGISVGANQKLANTVAMSSWVPGSRTQYASFGCDDNGKFTVQGMSGPGFAYTKANQRKVVQQTLQAMIARHGTNFVGGNEFELSGTRRFKNLMMEEAQKLNDQYGLNINFVDTNPSLLSRLRRGLSKAKGVLKGTGGKGPAPEAKGKNPDEEQQKQTSKTPQQQQPQQKKLKIEQRVDPQQPGQEPIGAEKPIEIPSQDGAPVVLAGTAPIQEKPLSIPKNGSVRLSPAALRTMNAAGKGPSTKAIDDSKRDDAEKKGPETEKTSEKDSKTALERKKPSALFTP